MRPSSRLALVVISAVLVASEALASSAVVGEWNDVVGDKWKHHIKITQDGERFLRISRFGDGRARPAILVRFR